MSGRVEERKPRVARLPAASRVVKRDPCVEEVAVLRLISEQNGVQLDQLTRFFGVYMADMVRFVEEMREQGWVEMRRLVKGDPPWVWLRGAGARHAGLGFSPVRPSLATIAHWHAITEARLYLMGHAPGGDWICERAVMKRRGKGKPKRRGKAKRKPTVHIPDGVFKIEGEVHVIEAELSRKTPKNLESIVAQHSSRYDAAVYFCSPSTYLDIERLGLEKRYPRLFTCCLVEDLRPLAKEEFRVEDDNRRRLPSRAAESWEVAILDLVAEQGAIPIDLLARFLHCEEQKADGIASHLLEAGFVMRAQPEADRPDWIWVGQRGMNYVTVDVGTSQTTLGGLPRLRALSEVRLRLLERTEGSIEWTSGRELRHRHGPEGSLPDAVAVEETSGGRRRRRSYAIDVKIHLATSYEKLLKRYELRAKGHDYVLWYCAPKARQTALRLKKEFGCPKLVVRTIPGYRPPRDGRRRRKAEEKKAAVYLPVEVHDVEREAFEVVTLAAGRRKEPVRIKSVERRQRVVMKEYRIGTDDGRWCVRLSSYGWKAEEILE